jgi:serine/threonine protein phosphatase PrpC
MPRRGHSARVAMGILARLSTPVRSAQLRGPDHPTLGGIAVVAEGPVAIALSRGGAPKRYAHREPNEDAAGFAWSEWGIVLAVADGHEGSAAACLAIERVLSQHAPRWLERAPISLETRFDLEAASVVRGVQHAIVADTPMARGRTTLAVALARPREGWLGLISVGDSLLFTHGDAGSHALGAPRDKKRDGPTIFLGNPRLDIADLVAATFVGVMTLRGEHAVVLASDGLSEEGIGVADPERAISQAATQAARAPADLRPLTLARSVVSIALEAQRSQRAGDNVASAALWLG